ncbi:MAG: mannose-6-phosphate isomerase, class I [Pseudomonadota bacterium]
MNRISFLNNPVQEYAWGSKTAIQSLLGEPVPSERPAAELWMGAHPKSPSMVLIDGKWQSLEAVIRRSPALILGEKVARRFSNRLPFLFKVLAAEKPLSIQVHPNLKQAQEGFKRENSLGIPLDAPNRNYRDPNHKPEIICALRPLQALKGFRKIDETLALMEKVSCSMLSNELALLRQEPNPAGLKRFFGGLMGMERKQQGLAVAQVAGSAQRLANQDGAFFWVAELNRQCPNDIGVLSPLLLNLVHLEPGEAIYLPAGELHAYLQGVGVELMANSDNVLRGGLTHKHIDVSEVMRIVTFETGPVEKVESVSDGPCHRKYVTPSKEFLLSVISLDDGEFFESPEDRSVEILICIEGSALVKDLRGKKAIELSRGSSVVVPSAEPAYRIAGDATIYKASVPEA